MKFRNLRIAATVLILVASCVAVFYVYLLFGIMSAVVLAVFAGLPLSLLIPVTAIRYAIMGAYAGTLAGFVALACITLATWGALSEQFNTLVTLACYGGGAIGGSAIGVAIALRGKS